MAQIVVSPEQFHLVAFDAEVIASTAESVADAVGLPADLEVRVEVDETSPLGAGRLVALHPVTIWVQSGALEDAKHIHAELREFLAIELNYAQLSPTSRELLNRLAAFRQSVPYEAAEWVMGKKISYAADFLEANRDTMPEEWKALGEAEILQMLEATLPERRQAEDRPQLEV